MLIVTRNVYRDCGERNLIVLDLPDGRRVKLWVIPTSDRGGPRKTRQVAVGIEAPADVKVLRGEHLGDPWECVPQCNKPPAA